MTTREIDRIRFVTQHFKELQGLRMVPIGIGLVCLGLINFLPFWPRPMMILALALFVASVVIIFWVPSYYRSFGEVEPRPAVLGAELSALSIYRPAGSAPLAVERRPMKASASLWHGPLILLAVALVFLLRAILPATLILTDGSGVDPWAQFHAPVVEVLEKPAWPSGLSEVESLLGQGTYAFIGAYFLSAWFLRGRRPSQSYHLVLGSLLLGLAVLGSCLGLVLTELWKLGMTGTSHILLLPPASRVLLLLAYFWMATMLCGISLILASLLDHLQLVRVLKPAREIS